MRISFLALGAATLLAIGPAAAQGTSRSDDATRSDTYRSDRGDRDRDWRDSDRPWRRFERWVESDDHRGEGRSGARFMVRQGDTTVAVRCSSDESMRACIEAVTTLMDRVRSMPASRSGQNPPAQ